MDEQSDAEDASILSVDRVRFQDGTLRVRRIALVFRSFGDWICTPKMGVYIWSTDSKGQVSEGTLDG